MPKPLALTPEAKSGKLREGIKLHPVRVEDEGMKGPDGKKQKVAYIGSRKVALGRIKDKPDKRDKKAKVSSMLAAAPAPVTLLDTKYWGDNTWRGDQNGFPQCVAYSHMHRVENSPRTYPAPGVVLAPKILYDRAQQIDEWAGTNYDGTSVRAGCAASKERGFISVYERIETFQEFIDHLRMPASAGGGPVLIGVDWTEDMFSPTLIRDAQGKLRWTITATGAVAGGHAVLANGVNQFAEVIRILNSWGLGWGVDGRCSMGYDTAEDLLFNRGGDAWRVVEIAA